MQMSGSLWKHLRVGSKAPAIIMPVEALSYGCPPKASVLSFKWHVLRITDYPKSTSPLEELYCNRLLFILSLMTWTHPDSSHLMICWGCTTKKCKTSRLLGHTSIIYPSNVYYIYIHLIHILYLNSSKYLVRWNHLHIMSTFSYA